MNDSDIDAAVREWKRYFPSYTDVFSPSDGCPIGDSYRKYYAGVDPYKSAVIKNKKLLLL